MRRPHFLEPALDARGRWGLRLDGTETWLATDAELAGTSATRRRGLAGRESMPAGSALVIAPSQGIHTFGMRFAIDLVAADRDGVVVAVMRDVPPWRVRVAWRAFAMIELPAGTAASSQIRRGDRLVATANRMVPR